MTTVLSSKQVSEHSVNLKLYISLEETYKKSLQYTESKVQTRPPPPYRKPVQYI